MPERPQNLTGSCLCGAIKFTINLSKDDEWPPKSLNATCQCTMCRKQTGSIIPQNCGFKTKSIIPPLQDNPEYKQYESSSRAFRGFCGKCGSPLTFGYKDEPETTEIFLGAFDEEVLCGKPDEANAWEDEYGRHVPRVGGVGKELCYATFHLFLENAIPGVTDDLPGTKYLKERADGKGFTCKFSDLKNETSQK